MGKTHPNARIEHLLRTVQQGLDRLHERLHHLEQPAPAAAPSAPQKERPMLTDQQRTFVRLACRDEEYTVHQIAAEMGIRPSTVRQHAKAVYRKLQVRTRQGLVVAAVRQGLIAL